jgi:flagellar biosynthetic protein FliO
VKKIFVSLLFVLVFCSQFQSVFSQTNKKILTNKVAAKEFNYSAPEKINKSTGYFGLVIKTLFILGIFTVALYYIFKFISKKQGLNYQNINLIKIISSTPVGANRFLLLVELSGSYFLLGSTDSNISLIKEITDKDVIAQLEIQKNKQSNTVPRNVNFADFMKEMFGPAVKRLISRDEKNFIKKEKDRLKKMNKFL